MRRHGLVDLSHDDAAGRLNTQILPDLHDVIGGGLSSPDTDGPHHPLHVMPLHKHIEPERQAGIVRTSASC